MPGKKFILIAKDSPFGREITAGVSSFAVLMGSLLMVPLLLSHAGVSLTGAYTATVLAALLGTLGMGLWAQRPLVVAPNIGVNAWLIYSVVISRGIPWQEALGASFAAALLSVLFCFLPCCRRIFQGVPACLMAAARGGLGLLLIFLGLRMGKLLAGSPATITMLGDFSEPAAFLALVGLGVTLVLLVNRQRGAIFLGILAAAAVALLQGFMVLPDAPFFVPEGLDRTAGQLSFAQIWQLLPVVCTLCLVQLFDTRAVLWGLQQEDDGRLEIRACGIAAGSTLLGALLGTGPLRAAPESAAAGAAGGRSGKAALVTAGCLLLWLFCEPLAAAFLDFPAVFAPAVIAAGIWLLLDLRQPFGQDNTEKTAALAVMLVTPLSYSLTAGLGAGFILYTFLRLFNGQGKDIHPITYVLTALFILQYVFFEP